MSNELPRLNRELEITGRFFAPPFKSSDLRRLVEGVLYFHSREQRVILFTRGAKSAATNFDKISFHYRPFPLKDFAITLEAHNREWLSLYP